MKYLKKFENLNTNKFVIVDNVDIKYKDYIDSLFLKFVTENIGYVRYGNNEYLIVDYDVKPISISQININFVYHEENNTYSTVLRFNKFDFILGDTLEDIKYKIELKKDSKKYNL